MEVSKIKPALNFSQSMLSPCKLITSYVFNCFMGTIISVNPLITLPDYFVIANAFPSIRLGRLEIVEVLYVAVL